VNVRHSPMLSGGLLITGCPRSGTLSAQKFYEKRNVLLGHETAGEMGTVDYRNAYMDFDLNGENPPFTLVNVLVRDPLSTVASLESLLVSATTKPNIGSDTDADIRSLAKQGDWLDSLDKKVYLDSAVKWWTSVYDRLQFLPVLRVEDWPNLPHEHEHTHSRKTLTANDVRRRIPAGHQFWSVARIYGYYR